MLDELMIFFFVIFTYMQHVLLLSGTCWSMNRMDSACKNQSKIHWQMQILFFIKWSVFCEYFLCLSGSGWYSWWNVSLLWELKRINDWNLIEKMLEPQLLVSHQLHFPLTILFLPNFLPFVCYFYSFFFFLFPFTHRHYY